MDFLHTLEGPADAAALLEEGNVVLLPVGGFALEADDAALRDESLLGGAKNISLSADGRLKHTAASGETRARLQAMMARYAAFAEDLMGTIAPPYRSALVRGRTSFRPAEIEGRKSSPIRDDSRLHVDAFPATPMQGRRILRVFCNVNAAAPRIWNIGEPFPAVAERFLRQIRVAPAALRRAMAAFGVTKGYRTSYDALMLGLHDHAKRDMAYQAACEKQRVELPPGAVWLCYTDQVMHAALKGQHVLEQTFYLPPGAMVDPSTTPLAVLEKMTGKNLI